MTDKTRTALTVARDLLSRSATYQERHDALRLIDQALAQPSPAIAMTDEQITNAWYETFSTSNPFCPCDLKSFTKAARAVERAHGIKS